MASAARALAATVVSAPVVGRAALVLALPSWIFARHPLGRDWQTGIEFNFDTDTVESSKIAIRNAGPGGVLGGGARYTKYSLGIRVTRRLWL
jgi:hypothetical protein